MLQLPLLPPIWIRRPSQRDREPHGQYGNEATTQANLAIHHKGLTESKRTVSTHFIARGESGQPRTLIVQADSVLTETNAVDRCPGVLESAITKWSRNRGGDGEFTFVKRKDSWTYTWRTIIARKYAVASVNIVRANTENLSMLLLRYVYQPMTRNADSSKCTT